ncbi:hypothetical protein [Christiangramia sabulilitoris]|uniref:Uncharacterized protein n=1 Tax=Christiangramia sabulilitoris TaxID=2583991 RepID=A0A550I7K7_9FLAO|nr:hypothetical protein [Christiangramia sabulilitoris]TRO66954.1 hypothetical protein FGM01_03425 [Christiangramia sabulilitoris]
MEEEYIELNRENDRIEILTYLKDQYPFYINPDLSSLKIFQTQDCVFLEKIYKAEPSEVVSEPLNFITGYFDPANSLEQNAADFFGELDEYTIMMCFEDIFTEEAAEEIIKKEHPEEN